MRSDQTVSPRNITIHANTAHPLDSKTFLIYAPFLPSLSRQNTITNPNIKFIKRIDGNVHSFKSPAKTLRAK